MSCQRKEVFWNFSGTVWMKSSLWKMMGILLMIALCIASSVALMVSDPAAAWPHPSGCISRFCR